MTFFQFSAPLAGQKYDYPTLGFFAVDSAILDGTASNPQITAAPDAHWTVVASGPESGITRYRQPQTPPDDLSSWDGSLLVYDATTRAFVRKAPPDAIASTTGLGQALNTAIADNPTVVGKADLTQGAQTYASKASPMSAPLILTDRFCVGVDNATPMPLFISNDRAKFYNTDTGTTNLGLPSGVDASTVTTDQPPMFRRYNGTGYNYFTILKQSGSSQFSVYKGPGGGSIPYSWTKVLDLTTGATSIQTNVTGNTSYVFVGEYGDPVDGSGNKAPSIWRSADGVTWAKCYTAASTVRHCHAVAVDPYNPGHVYATFGDGDTHVGMLIKSTDNGATWTELFSGAFWQSVQITFTPTHIFLASDGDFLSGPVVVDRGDPTNPKMGSAAFHGWSYVPGMKVGDTFFSEAYAGAYDTNSGCYFFLAKDGRSYGSRFGLFYVPEIGGRPELVQPLPDSYEVGYIFLYTDSQSNRYLYTGNARFDITKFKNYAQRKRSRHAQINVQTASYTVNPLDDVVVVNSGTAATVTLPDPTTVNRGRRVTVKNTNATAASVVSAGTSKTIDGAASVSLAQWATGTYISDGTQWLAV